jgi:hypothetical protein
MAVGQGCACVYLDATTGALMVDGVPFAGGGTGTPGGPVNPATGISAGALNSAVTVAPSQISPAGTLPAGTKIAAADVTGLCVSVLACLTTGSVPLSALAAGSLPAGTQVPVANIVGGAAGTVLTSDATGKPAWVAAAATPVGGPISPTSTGLASGQLNPGVLINASQITTGVLPASAIPCTAVLACVSAPGAIPASAIGAGNLGAGVKIPGTSVLGGTAGQALISDGTNGVWTTLPSGSAPATAETLGGSVLKSTVTVPAAQITGVLPAASIPCGAVLACVSAAPDGSIPASKLAPGTAGQVLTTSAAGVTAWATPAAASGAPTGQQVADAYNSAAAITSPAAAGSIAQVHGENAAGAPITAGPKQVIEAGMADSPLSTAAAPVAFVSGTDATGNSVRTKVQPVGTKTVGTATPSVVPFPTGSVANVATVTAPESGMYCITIAHAFTSVYAGGAPNPQGIPNQHEWFVTTAAGRVYDVLFNDYYPGYTAQIAGARVVGDTVKTTLGACKLAAGEVVKLQVYGNSSTAAISADLGGGLTLIKVGDNDLVTPDAA